MGNGNEPKLDGKKSFSVIGANEEFQLQNVKYNDKNQEEECKNDLGVMKIWEANDKQNRDIFAYFSHWCWSIHFLLKHDFVIRFAL